MEQLLFDSLDVESYMSDAISDWDAEADGPKPQDPRDDRVETRAWEILKDDYRYLSWMIESNMPGGEVLVFGKLGRWNGHPFGYALKSSQCPFAFEWDQLEILYKAGDIWINIHHHDGTHHMCVRGLKTVDNLTKDLENGHITESRYNELRECLDNLHAGYEFSEDQIMDFVEDLTFSVAPFYSDFLSNEAKEDMDRPLLELCRRAG